MPPGVPPGVPPLEAPPLEAPPLDAPGRSSLPYVHGVHARRVCLGSEGVMATIASVRTRDLGRPSFASHQHPCRRCTRCTDGMITCPIHCSGRGGCLDHGPVGGARYDEVCAPVAQWTERGRPKACVGGVLSMDAGSTARPFVWARPTSSWTRSAGWVRVACSTFSAIVTMTWRLRSKATRHHRTPELAIMVGGIVEEAAQAGINAGAIGGPSRSRSTFGTRPSSGL